jgi:hypothetical protein
MCCSENLNHHKLTSSDISIVVLEKGKENTTNDISNFKTKGRFAPDIRHSFSYNESQRDALFLRFI